MGHPSSGGPPPAACRTPPVTTGIVAPRYVKLQRSGSNFSAYESSNGTTWNQVGTTQSITMAASVYVGLCVTAHNNTTLCTGTFDNVSVTAGGGDTTAPAAVSNLADGSPTSNSITLTWTAPGDDGAPARPASYDIRYRTGGAVNDSNWASATQVTGEPTPAVAGTNQNMVVTACRPAPPTTSPSRPRTRCRTSRRSPTAPAARPPAAAAGIHKPILGQSDFVYQGYYIVDSDGSYNNLAELEYGQGFTHRYVSGQLRFLTFSFFGNVPGGGNHVIEFAPPASGLGGTVTTRTNHWPDIMGSPAWTSAP